MIEIPSDLHPRNVPLAFLLGIWEGAGVCAPVAGEKGKDLEQCNFGQEVTFRHDGRPFLEYVSRTWVLDAEGKKVRPLESESGYWRIDEERRLQVVMSRDDGVIEIWYGELAPTKPQIDLATDAVVRIPDGPDYTAGKRLYGLVNGDLLWVFEKAASSVPMRPYMSAQLKKVPNPATWVQDLKDLPDDGIAFFR
ncbi:fatty acid-binding protein [Wenjunlia vitaminophila]|uniref:Ferric nitrobindin-like protein n=1 Tax=Wenjunlia vitaminophila TaxID=76728 RepID=A0A0T6LYA5_WENVI|nr:FABP family protein [Wenjunlia vitaminophila]KRV51092.1 fatty acid-binding protein [Wenjunlia vitaminophila]